MANNDSGTGPGRNIEMSNNVGGTAVSSTRLSGGWDCPDCIQKDNVIHLCVKCKEEQLQRDRELVQALTGHGWSSRLGDELIVGKTQR